MNKKNVRSINIKYLFAVFFNSLFILSFEIIATRIASVVFVYNYVFIIISLALLGLTLGSIFVFYIFRTDRVISVGNWIVNFFVIQIFSILIFIIVLIHFQLAINIFLYFVLILIPFFAGGAINSVVFKSFGKESFLIYAFDLIGGSLGALLSVIFLNVLGPPNSLLFLILLLFIPISIFILKNKKEKSILYSILAMLTIILFLNGQRSLIGEVPIGKFPEKDFYYVFPDETIFREIVESRWSIYGRADLVRYGHQNLFMSLFIDGAAGTRMYGFNGDIANPNPELMNILFSHSTALPFLLTREDQKDNMLIIGPGGGKEVLIGLLTGVRYIDGVEVNPDFVKIVKKYSGYNGGLYSNYPNVKIFVSEGRHFVKRSNKKYDIIVLALPSTEQAQNVEIYAANENFLLTKEAIKDYFRILSNEGMLIFTLHNEHEVLRIINTVVKVFEDFQIDTRFVPYYISIIKGYDSPTVVIKKRPFSKSEEGIWVENRKKFPSYFPNFIYLPYYNGIKNSEFYKLLEGMKNGSISLKAFADDYKLNISACNDDKPYFYNIKKGIPDDFKLLSFIVIIFNLLIIIIPYFILNFYKNKEVNNCNRIPWDILVIFLSLGAGFIILELSLFQKLILFLGAPTISLVILLISLLISMGIGSYYNEKLFKNKFHKKIFISSLMIVLYGLFLFLFIMPIIYSVIGLPLVLRISITFALIFPLGFLLGIPFPTAMKILSLKDRADLIPWMYGINGCMSVFGSIFFISISIIYGYKAAFITGLGFYMLILVVSLKQKL